MGIEDEDDDEGEEDDLRRRLARGGRWCMRRILMKKARPLSHLAAARATSLIWLRRALFKRRMRAQRRRRSPLGRLVHHCWTSRFLVFMPATIKRAEGHFWGYTQRFFEKVIHDFHILSVQDPSGTAK